MAFTDCLSAVVAAIGRRISVDEFDALYTRLFEERDRLFRGGFPSDWLTVSQTIARQIEIEKAIAQRNVLRNKITHADLKSFLKEARGQVDAGRALEARLVGINTPIAGGRRSIAAEAHGLWLTSAGALFADLRRAAGGASDRLIKLFSTPAYEEEIAKALRGEPAQAEARAIADAIKKTREDLRRQENEAGGFRGALDGYVTRQSHDSLKVRQAGYEKWKARILPMLDHDKTFDRQEELLAQLRLERGQVLQHRLAVGAEIKGLYENLDAIKKMDRKAEARGKRQDDNAAAMRNSFQEALSRFLELSGGEETPERLTARQQARRDVATTREGIRHMERKASAVRQMQPELREQLEAERALIDRAMAAVEVFDDLGAKIKSYESRLRGAVDPDTFLQRIYNAIAADTRLRGDAQEFTGLMKYIGPSNLARSRAAHRELHFKSAADEVQYMREFGAGGVSDTILREMEGAASAIALLRGLGPNPEAMFQTVRAELLQEAREKGDNALTRAVTRKSLDWYLAEVLGSTRAVANPTLAAWGASIRTLQGMAKLGGAMLSSFGDIPTAASELKYQGRGALQSYADMFEGLFKGRRSGEKRVIADLLGVGFEALSGHVLSRLGGESAPPGALAKASAVFFRLNGLSWWTDAHKTSAGLVISRFFASMREQGFAELPRQTQRTLKQFALDSRDWDILRQAAVHEAEDGTAFLTPEGVKAIPLDHFMEEGTTPAMAREARDRLAGAYAALVVDRVDHAVISPGARERAMVNMGTERGDLLGEALRFVMQFKSFGLAMVTRSFGRDIYGGEGGKLSATAKLSFLAFQLAIFGYMSMSAKALLSGKNPRDPNAPDTWAAAMAQGGGMGILGDFAFGEFNRFGNSALATAAGPTFGTADDLFHLYATARDPDVIARGKWGKQVAAEGLRTIAANTPFASLWWMRPALNYLALYPVQEALSPGYLRRMESRIQRENKQTFWLSPQEAPRL